HRADAGAAGIVDVVGHEAEVMAALAEEAVEGVVLAIEVQAAEFKVRSAGREAAAAELEHGLAGSAGGPNQIHRAVAVALVNDPGRRRAAGGRIEGGAHVVSAGEQADHGAGLRSGSGAVERFGRGSGSAGVAVVARRRRKQGAIGGRGAVADGESGGIASRAAA